MPDYFFELLTEEIPAWMHDAAAATLHERLTKLASEAGAGDGAANAVLVNTTPRRIAFAIKQLPEREADASSK
jgi:glycyl-tRNA synthetase beta subunit